VDVRFREVDDGKERLLSGLKTCRVSIVNDLTERIWRITNLGTEI